MSRNVNPHIHIYFPEASTKGNKINLCEFFYIKHSFQRKITQAKIIGYPEEQKKEFKKALNSVNKKNSLSAHDLFFIVLDTDINPSRSNVNIIISQIQSLHKNFSDAKIILSGRSFEVWLCMYSRSHYTAPFSSQSSLNSDVGYGYIKTESWYIDNSIRLYDDYIHAQTASVQSKKLVFPTTSTPPPSGYNLVYNIPDFSDQAVVNYLVNTTPFTYIEHLIDTILLYK